MHSHLTPLEAGWKALQLPCRGREICSYTCWEISKATESIEELPQAFKLYFYYMFQIHLCLQKPNFWPQQKAKEGFGAEMEHTSY